MSMDLYAPSPERTIDLINRKISACAEAILSLAIDARACDMTGDSESKTNITKQLGDVMKKRDAFERILAEETKKLAETKKDE